MEQLIKETRERNEQVPGRVKRPIGRVNTSSSISHCNSTFLQEFLAKTFKQKYYYERYLELAEMIPKHRAALFIIQNRRLFLDNDDETRKVLEELFRQEYDVH